MKALRVFVFLFVAIFCSFSLVLPPDIGSGLKAAGTNVTWLNICALTGLCLAISVLFVEVFPKGYVSGLHFPQSLSLALMAASSIVVIVALVSILDFDSSAVKNAALTRLTCLFAFIMSSTGLHLSLELFRYGEKLPTRQPATA